ncbi:MAG: hypothetical protein HYR50_04555 [Candidatus Rokubacteria bacterium]|nr:hypothetical protein [Candidatus Rokubacteria bacterium]
MGRLSPQVLKCLVTFLLLSLVAAGGSWADSGKAGARQASPGSTAEVVEEIDFDSFDQLQEWLKGRVDITGEHGANLSELRGGIDPNSHGCLIPSAIPNPIVVTKPNAFKIVQIQYTIVFGTTLCGNVLCTTVFFKQDWLSAPSAGAILIGPIPSQSQLCQGNTTTAKGILILTNQVPTGGYTIKFQSNGAGEFSSVNIPVTIQ